MSTESTPKRSVFGALLLLLMGVAGMGAGGFLFLADKTQGERKAAALAEGPPPAVELQDFAAAPVTGAAGNIRLIAQVDFTLRKPITSNSFLGEGAGFVLPLLAPEATALDRDQTLGVLLFTGENAAFTDRQLERLLDRMVAMGANGPVVDIEGFAASDPAFLSAANVAFAAEGRLLPSNVVMLEPFMDGRAWALSPGAPNYLPMGVGAAGVVIFLLGLVLMMRRSTGGAKAPVAVAARHVMIPAYVPEMATGSGGAGVLKRVLNPAEATGNGAISVYRAQHGTDWDGFDTADDDTPEATPETEDFEALSMDTAADLQEPAETTSAEADTPQPAEEPEAEPEPEAGGLELSEVLALAEDLNADEVEADSDGEMSEEEVQAILAEVMEDWDDDEEEDEGDTPAPAPPADTTDQLPADVMLKAVRLGSKDDKPVKLSKRDSAKLEADPLMKRLAKF